MTDKNKKSNRTEPRIPHLQIENNSSFSAQNNGRIRQHGVKNPEISSVNRHAAHDIVLVQIQNRALSTLVHQHPPPRNRRFLLQRQLGLHWHNETLSTHYQTLSKPHTQSSISRHRMVEKTESVYLCWSRVVLLWWGVGESTVKWFWVGCGEGELRRVRWGRWWGGCICVRTCVSVSGGITCSSFFSMVYRDKKWGKRSFERDNWQWRWNDGSTIVPKKIVLHTLLFAAALHA